MPDPSLIQFREEVAIIGMAGRFPGARNIQAFWRNLREGIESIKSYTIQELQAAGIDVSVLSDPAYVNAGAVMDDADLFDASFFGFSPREAEITDPQHRVFLECAWEALENAGYDVETYSGFIGVYGGVARNTYFFNNVAGHQDLLKSVGSYQTLIGSEKDFPATRVSYKLNLKGPSINVQTACSTSGVALHLACQSLLSGECDMALAGGARIQVPLKSGYFYQEGGILSPDGHCRAFDAKARGTVIGSGVAIVVLKRLSEAIRDRDCIRAIIKGTAINNDGSAKIGFTAPSVEGQSRAIAEAHAIAEVDPETITYIETHGTGTSLGDPIEIAALTKVFKQSTERKGYCAIGSVKTNIGHLDAGAGAAGVIKAVLALEHKLIPPSLNFDEPNPQIDFQNSPFFVNSKLSEWKAGSTPRRAGVSAFGLGGTNAHIVLEEAPAPEPPAESRPWKLLPLSAKSSSALDASTSNLLEHLQNHSDVDLADVAYTLQVGRKAFTHRRMMVAQDLTDAIKALSSSDPRRIITENQNGRVPSICFLFPGGGAQYINMGLEIYQTEPVFRNWMDECFKILKPQLDIDLKDLVYQKNREIDKAAEELTIPKNALPALFATEYSLAKLLISWGLEPSAMIGHSLGEYAAACLSGVLSLEDAFSLVIARSRLFEKLQEGGMLSVPLSVEEIRSLGVDGLSIAAINRPALCVVSGSTASIDEMQKVLTARQTDFSRLHISVAAHSHMVEPILAEFRELVRKIRFQQPQIPYVSNVTGEWITAAEAMDPDYWVKHLRQTVRFSDGLQTLFADADRLLLEVGPGQTLSTFARQHPDKKPEHIVLASLRHPKEHIADAAFLFNTIGRLWLAGAPIQWADFNHHEKRRRVELPSYPFEGKRYWIDPVPAVVSQTVPNILPQEDFSKMITSDGELAATAAVSEGEVTPVSQIPAIPTMSRKDRVVGILQNIIHDLSGMNQSEMDPNATFLEMGFESLFLTQASAAFQNELGVDISFRQLFEDTPSLDSLAAYVDSKLPPDALAVPDVAAPVVAPVAAAVPAPSSVVAAPQAAGTAPTNQVPLSGNALERIAVGLEALVGILRGGGVVASQQLDALTKVATASLAAPQIVEKKPAQPVPEKKPAQAVTEKKPPSKTFGPWKPIEKGAGGKLTSRQQKHLNALIARFTARTSESKRLTQQHRERLADPRTVAGFRLAWKEMVYPIVASRAVGSKIWDVDGNEWLDITQGFGISLFGHSPSFVVEAVQKQLKESMAIGPQTPLAGKVADLIHELTGMERVAFCNTGSEAVLAALRVTRTVSGRNRIATFSGAYHGVFDEVLVRGITVNGQRRSMPVAPGIPPRMVEDVLVLNYGESESLEVIHQHAKELAAVLVEPIQSRNPSLQPREFLHSLRDVTKKLGIPLIFDEMITGFRLHHRGAQGWFGVDADLAAYGKVIAGGMPIGVVAGKAKYMDALDGGRWRFGDASVPEVGVTWFAGTFVRHPLSLAAAYASLTHLKEQGAQLQQQLNEKTSSFVSEINNYFQKNSFPIRLVHFASLFLIHFEGDQEYAGLFWHHLRDKGIHTHEGRPNFLTTAHTEEDMANLVRAFKESAIEMRKGGFLSESSVVAAPEGEGSLPPTEPQRELLQTAHTNVEGSCALNLSYSIDLKGDLNLEGIRSAIQQLINRHDALRMTFLPPSDSLHFAPALKIDVPFFDLSNLEERKQKGAIDEKLHVEVTKPFDLASGPLVRAQVIKLAERHHVVVFTVHHTACDPFSSVNLMREFGILYSVACSQIDPQLPPAMQFSEYARWQKEQQETPEHARAEEYWLKQCANPIPDLELPADYPRPSTRTYGSAVHQFKIDNTLVSDLKQAGSHNGCSFFTLLLSGVALLLHKLSAQEDVIVGIPASGQSIVGHNELVGHCVNLHPFRSRIRLSDTIADYLKASQRTVLDNYEQRNFSYGSLLKKLRLSSDPARMPLFSVQFSMDPGVRRGDFYQLESRITTNPRRFYHFELGINAVESDGELLLRAEFNRSLFKIETVQSWMESLQALLKQIVAEPGATLSTLLSLQPKDLNRESRVPLTDGQKEVWTATLLGKEASCAFNESNNIHLSGSFDLDAMRKAIQQVVDRHEALRTSFEPNGEYQKISASVKTDVPFLDLTSLDAETKDLELKKVIQKQVEEPFDLSNPPLIRTTIVRLKETHHILVFTYHHTVVDGWSMGVILNELAKLYSAEAQGIKSELPNPMQYRQYVGWQAEQKQKPERAETEAFWIAQFTGTVPVLDLPTDRPRTAFRTYNAALERKSFGPALLTSLKKVGAKKGSTLFTTLFAIFRVLLYRLSHQNDAVVGIPTAGQSLVGATDLIGHCVNFLPIRDRIDGTQPFSDYLAATKRLMLDALEHQNFTFLNLLSKLNLRRDFSRLPLIETAFNLDRKAKAPSFFNLEVEVVYNPKKYLNYDIFFNFVQSENDLMLECFYNSDLFDAETIKRWLEHLNTLLESVVSVPEDPITQLPLLSTTEMANILMDAPRVHPEQTIHESPGVLGHTDPLQEKSRLLKTGPSPMHRLFEEQVRKTPRATALVFEDQHVTYDELNKRSNQLAHLLKKCDVRPETLVGICMDRSVEMVVGILGILKSGGAYLPIDLAYPPERASFMLQDAGVKVLLTQKKLLKRFDQKKIKVVCLDSDHELINRELVENPVAEVAPENLCYVIYTSGSTGKPKGVLITHSNVFRLFTSTEAWFHFNASDVWTLFHSTAFDFSVWELWGALIYGGRLVVVPYLVSRSPDTFYSLLVRERVTVLNQTPSAFYQLIDAQEKASPSDQLSLRYVIFGGEALESGGLQRWFDRNGDQKPQLINMYGITETTVHVTYKALKAADVGVSSGSLIGVPIPDLQVYILDPYLQPVPIGIAGEIFVGGAGVARGYLNRPELTSERFIQNPFLKDPSFRLYKSGDSARYLRNGQLEFFGRLDFQVKVRGYRIELGEIESHLLEHPQVKNCVVVAIGEEADKRLIAYILPKVSDEQLQNQLRTYLKERLPEYMVPSAFMLLEALPLTPNGKVDRRALPLPEKDILRLRDDFEEPRDQLELQLTKIWEKILNVQPVGIHDNFFEIGGHSLLAVRLFTEIDKTFGKRLSLASLFHAPTVEQLAKLLRQEGLSSWSSLVPIQISGSKLPFYAIHAGGGHVLFYRDLAKRLRPDYPFYALQAQGLDGRMPRHNSVEEMAAHYIQEIRSLQPEGPYHLGGASFGGLVAYEMACQLEADGHKVGVIALFDTHAPGYPVFLPSTSRIHSRVHAIVERIEHHAGNLLVAEWDQKFPYVLQKTRKAKTLFMRWIKRNIKSGLRLWSSLIRNELPKPLQQTQDTILDANESYIPRDYSGPVTIFRASKQPYGIYPDPTLGWSKFSTNLRVYEVPGYHGGIISEPRVTFTAKILKDCLEEESTAAESKHQIVSIENIM